MLKAEDLDLFIEMYRSVESESSASQGGEIADFLTDENGLFTSEVWRLSRSARIAASAGFIGDRIACCAEKIWEAMRGRKCKLFSDADSWKGAIRCALRYEEPRPPRPNVFDRQNQVGLACGYLTKQRFQIEYTAFGPQLTPAAQQQIFLKADALAGLIGGEVILYHIFEFLKDNKSMYDGFWMLGNRVANINQKKTPSLPVGWL